MQWKIGAGACAGRPRRTLQGSPPDRARGPRGARAAAHLDTLLDGHDRPAPAAHRAPALAAVLRAAVDPGLDDRPAALAPEPLGALPREAFGLLRPSGPPPPRAALPPGTRAAEFEDVEVSRHWHPLVEVSRHWHPLPELPLTCCFLLDDSRPADREVPWKRARPTRWCGATVR
ncbi:hypothetical protein [Streptomyces cinerochromogenes]|uniref:hypothetical protein n=1 Tax=Streptomyces cinerochromogenes TaxID=66422 RepID=UPI0033A698E2